jgi:hypothetical protein
VLEQRATARLRAHVHLSIAPDVDAPFDDENTEVLFDEVMEIDQAGITDSLVQLLKARVRYCCCCCCCLLLLLFVVVCWSVGRV